MNILEALKSGKKIKRSHWTGFHSHEQALDGISSKSILAEDWEIEREYFDFFKAMELLNSGKKVSCGEESRNYYSLIDGKIMCTSKVNGIWGIGFDYNEINSKKWFEVE